MKPLDDKVIAKEMDETISITQIFEMAVLLGFLDEFKSVIDGKDISESNNVLRKTTAILVADFIKNINKPLKDYVHNVNQDELNIISKGHKNAITTALKSVVDNAHKEAYESIMEYVTLDKLSVDGKHNLLANFNAKCQLALSDLRDGNTTIQKAINELINELSKGLKVVDYNKTTRNVDVYVRQLCYYTERESTNRLKEQFAKDNDLHIWEFSAHADARPSHQIWQGKRFDDTGKDYPTHQKLNNFEDETDYNCRHRKYPVWDKNDKYMYSRKELANINSKPFMWGGKDLDGYQQTQKARAMERRIRELKRKNILDPNQNTEMLIRKKTKEYREFMKKCDTYPRYDRLKVAE